MKLLKTITDADIFENETFDVNIDYKERRAARAIVFDKNNKIALLYVARDNYYKLPGGGLEEGEDVVEALKRECVEEIGCDITVKGEVGEILEYRKNKNRGRSSLKQISYCYLADLNGEKGNPKFEQDELEDGFKEMWVDLDEAIKLVKETKTDAYNGNFIVKRDLAFLEAVKLTF